MGSTIELSFGASRIRARVTEAHDPPLRGAEHDRTSRGSESYAKDFKPLRLGVLSLEKGRGPLALRATEIPGKAVMDVRYVRLTLLESASGGRTSRRGLRLDTCGLINVAKKAS